MTRGTSPEYKHWWAIRRLVTSPRRRLPGAEPGAYSPAVADMYSSRWNNSLVEDPPLESVNLALTLPAGSTAQFPVGGQAGEPLQTIEGAAPPRVYAGLRMVVPAGWRGRLDIPLVVHALRGSGRFEAGGQMFEIGSAGQTRLLAGGRERVWRIALTASATPVEVLYLVNPKVYRLHRGENTLQLTGDGVDELDVSVGSRDTANSRPGGGDTAMARH